MTDEIMLKAKEDGSFALYESFANIEFETEEDFIYLCDMVKLGESIVRCEDCDNWDKDRAVGGKRYGNLSAPCSEWSHHEDYHVRYTRWDGFCNFGERRDDHETD